MGDRENDNVETPCIRVCKFDPVSELCLGCHRSRLEVRHWFRLPPDEKRAVLAALPARKIERKRLRAAMLGEGGAT